MMANTGSPKASGIQRVKRVVRACDYCRKKRVCTVLLVQRSGSDRFNQLKCTPDQRPCLNCQLYHVECLSEDRERRPVARRVPKCTGKRGPIEGAASTEHCEDTIQAGDPAQIRGAGSDIGTSLDSAIDTGSIFGSNPPASSWSPEDCFENGAAPALQDFGNVLGQLGIGVPSNFWDMDRTTSTDLPGIDTSFVNMQEESATFSQLLGNETVNGQTPFSDYTSPSSTSTGSLTNGKVSSIESLTRRVENSGSFQGSEPPAIYIRKNETAGHYVG